MEAIHTPLRGKYLVQRPLANGGLRLIDAFLEWLRPRGTHPAIGAPRRLLLCNGAHLGDVLLSTSLLPFLKKTFPEMQVGFLAGSWGRPVIDGDPHLERIHIFDHWKLNRSAATPATKLRRHFATQARALGEIRREAYDVAIDLYAYYPNSIPLLWRAGVPVRIGYRSGGFGPLLTHAVDWVNQPQHVIDYQADLLRVLPGAANIDSSRLLPPLSTVSDWAGARLLRKIGFVPGRYLVVHAGAGHAVKAWPRSKWRQLAESLIGRGERIILTGSGAEKASAASIACGLTGIRNLCGQLSWQQFCSVIRLARGLIAVDTVAGHIAAATGTPYVVISTGITHPAHWAPRGGSGRVVTHAVPCSPCYHSRGCSGMACVRGVEVSEVLAALAAVCGARAA